MPRCECVGDRLAARLPDINESESEHKFISSGVVVVVAVVVVVVNNT